jgi:hypothetical protein
MVVSIWSADSKSVLPKTRLMLLLISFADQDGIVEQSKYDVQNCQFPNTCHLLVYHHVKVMISFNYQEAILALQSSEPLNMVPIYRKKAREGK